MNRDRQRLGLAKHARQHSRDLDEMRKMRHQRPLFGLQELVDRWPADGRVCICVLSGLYIGEEAEKQQRATTALRA